MTLIQSILLGIIQGLTEFLPISSSAHLVLTPYLLGWNIPAQEAFIFNVLVQLGTLLAVILYFWKDLVCIIQAFIVAILNRHPFADPNARLGWYLILATVPAGLAGVAIKKQVEAAFSNPVATALLLLVTAAFLVIAERIGKRTRSVDQLNWKDALWIGIAQAVAIFPGVSRSGATIAAGMTRNLDRVSSGRFSFLMAVPVMLAAGLLEAIDLVKVPNLSSFLPIILAGFVTSALVGYLSIRWLLRYLTHRPLYIFAGYCVLLCVTVLAYTYV
jgi:undecaprenyl-diphosphatase